MDPLLLTAFAKSLLTWGPQGAIMGALGFWVWKQQQQLNRVQDRRVEDAMKVASAVHTFANALDRNTEALRAFVADDDKED